MTKKTSIIVVISVVIILISLILSIYIPNKDKIGEEIEDESIVYTVINENDKFGVKNEKDETVIEPQYEKIIIPNEHRAVFVCLNGEEKKILNNENKEIFTNYDDVEPIQLSNLTEEKYERNVLIYKSDDKYGLINMSGKIILDAKYDEIYSLGFKEGEIVVKENNKYGVVDSKGNIVIKNIYDSIESDEYYSQEDGYNKSGERHRKSSRCAGTGQRNSTVEGRNSHIGRRTICRGSDNHDRPHGHDRQRTRCTGGGVYTSGPVADGNMQTEKYRGTINPLIL